MIPKVEMFILIALNDITLLF